MKLTTNLRARSVCLTLALMALLGVAACKEGTTPIASRAASEPPVPTGKPVLVLLDHYERPQSLWEALYRARMHIALYDREQALQMLKASEDFSLQRGVHVKVAKLTYVQSGVRKALYLLLTGDPTWSDAMAKAMDHIRETGLVPSDMEVITLQPELSGGEVQQAVDEVIRQLQARRQDAPAQSFTEADRLLGALYDKLAAKPAEVNAYRGAWENLNLARALFNQLHYDASRQALNHAEEAFDEFKDSGEANSNPEKSARLSHSIDTMRRAILKRDPSQLDLINEELELWWEKFSLRIVPNTLARG